MMAVTYRQFSNPIHEMLYPVCLLAAQSKRNPAPDAYKKYEEEWGSKLGPC